MRTTHALHRSLAAALAFLTAGAPLPAQETPTFPAGVEVVTVDVVVLDKKGDPIEGLKAEAFTVTEDGAPQTVSSFEAVALSESAPAESASRMRVSTNTAPKPARSFVVVFDEVHLTAAQADKARKQLAEFFATGLSPGDEVTLVPTSGGGAWWTASMPEGYDDLTAVLSRLKGQRLPDYSAAHMTDWEAMRLFVGRDRQVGAEVIRRYYEAGVIAELPPAGDPTARRDLDLGEGHPQIRAKAAQIYVDMTARNKATLRALERAAASVSEAKGRKVLVLVSPGFVLDQTLNGFRDVIQACRRANAAIYFLDARGLTGLPVGADAERGVPVLEQDVVSSLFTEQRESQGAESLAVDSGGSVTASNDIPLGLRKVVRESRAYYLLGYQPTNTKRDGKLRKISVKVNRPDVEVRARKAYYAPSDEQRTRPGANEEVLDPRLRAAIDSPYDGDGIPMRLTSYVLGPASEGKAAVLLVAEADARRFAFKQDKDRMSAALDSFVILVSRDDGTNEHQEKRIDMSLPPTFKERLERSGLPVLRSFELKPGTYQARLLLRDVTSGRIGTVRHDFEVAPLSEFRVTTPILTDVLEPGPQGTPGRPVPQAHRQFATGTRLVHYFEVYGAALDPQTRSPRVTVSYSLVGTQGAVATVGPTALTPGPGGALSQQTVLPLEGLAPGRYEVAVTVKDELTRRTLVVQDAFAVVAAAGS